ncbi:MAG: ArsR family transcriptional regulator [Owenweeksia sp.]
MLEAIISSKTRIKLLLKFFLNPESSAYLRSLESEFGESTNAIRLELNRFESAGMLNSHSEGNRKIFRANMKHPLFKDIRGIVLKHIGLDQIVENIVNRLGNLEAAYITGDLARGVDVDVIDIILIGEPDQGYLIELVEKAEKLIGRRIRYLIYSKEEAEKVSFEPQKHILLWNAKS